jgi:hypothetical protein
MTERLAPEVLPAVELYLAAVERAGADAVRAAAARRLAAALDSPETPAYAVPRLVSGLRALLADLDGGASGAPAPVVDATAAARRLLNGAPL